MAVFDGFAELGIAVGGRHLRSREKQHHFAEASLRKSPIVRRMPLALHVAVELAIEDEVWDFFHPPRCGRRARPCAGSQGRDTSSSVLPMSFGQPDLRVGIFREDDLSKDLAIIVGSWRLRAGRAKEAMATSRRQYFLAKRAMSISERRRAL